MKNLWVTFLGLISFSSFAENLLQFSVKNITYPDYSIDFECIEGDCSRLDVKLKYVDWPVKQRIIDTEDLKQAASQKIHRSAGQKVQGDYWPYDLTTLSLEMDVNAQWREGYELRAVGNSVVIGLAALVDTIALPFSGFSYLYNSQLIGKKSKQNAKRNLKLISKAKDREYKQKEFNALVRFLGLEN